MDASLTGESPGAQRNQVLAPKPGLFPTKALCAENHPPLLLRVSCHQGQCGVEADAPRTCFKQHNEQLSPLPWCPACSPGAFIPRTQAAFAVVSRSLHFSTFVLPAAQRGQTGSPGWLMRPEAASLSWWVLSSPINTLPPCLSASPLG